jgi:hypothetical protein
MKTEIRVILPNEAAQLLANRHPRQVERFSESTAEAYADIMRKGSWDQYHPQGIAVSASGQLLDGQHRLRAIVISNMPQRMLIVTGVPESTYKHLDAGKARTLSFRSGYSKDDTAVYTFMLTLCTYGRTKRRFTVEDLDAAELVFGDVLALFNSSVTGTRKARLNPAPVRTAVILLLKRFPSQRDEILANYNALIAGEFKQASRLMSVFYRRITEEYGPALFLFCLAWKAFNPHNSELVKIQVRDISSNVHEARLTVLRELEDKLGLLQRD